MFFLYVKCIVVIYNFCYSVICPKFFILIYFRAIDNGKNYDITRLDDNFPRKFDLECDDGLIKCSDEFEKLFTYSIKEKFEISNVLHVAVEEFIKFLYEREFHIPIE